MLRVLRVLLRVLRVLWAHLRHGASPGRMPGPLDPRRQPPEQFGIAKQGALLRKPLFSMAQLLDPWILNAKGTKDAKGAVGPFGGC